jgi:hypothetical protein
LKNTKRIIAGYSPNRNWWNLTGTISAPNSKNDDEYQFARPRSTWKPNVSQIGGFLYFGGHFGFKMAAIANQNGCHMVQHVLLPVNKFRTLMTYHYKLFFHTFGTYIVCLSSDM